MFSRANIMYLYTRAVSFLAEALMMWATITESLHRTQNVHHDLTTKCPTAKTDLYGGAAFLALDASLFWLIWQMLALNARADYEEDEEDIKGQYGQVLTTEYNQGFFCFVLLCFCRNCDVRL